MLDVIVSELQEVKENALTKSELKELRQEINSQFQAVDERFNCLEQKVVGVEQKVTNIEQKMVTKDDLHKALTDSQNDVKAMLTIISENILEQDIKFRVINDRLFSHDIQIRHIKEEMAMAKEA